MTMGPVEIERKVRQLDNDVQSIYTMLSAIQGTQERHTNRLGELAVKVDNLDTKLDTLAATVDTLGTLGTKVDTLAATVDTLGTLGTKVDTLAATVDTLGTKVDTVLALLRRDTRE